MNFLKPTLYRPLSLPHVDEDGDEDMEMNQQGIEKGICVLATKCTNNNILRIKKSFPTTKTTREIESIQSKQFGEYIKRLNLQAR